MSTPTPGMGFLALTKGVLGKDRINAGEHGDIIRLLLQSSTALFERMEKKQQDKFASVEQDINLILLPRASYKTTIASVSFPIWLLEKNPNLRILLDSETYGLSKSILFEIKQHYENSFPAAGLRAFDSKTISRWSEDSIVVPTRTTPHKEPSIQAAGLDGVRAGAHYDIIIADDLHSQNNTKTSFQVEQVIEHYRLLLSLLEPHGLLIVIGTRWTESDAYTQIIKDATTSLFVPALSTKPYTQAARLIDRNAVRDMFNDDDCQVVAYDNQLCETVGISSHDQVIYNNFPSALPTTHILKIAKRQRTYIFSAQYILHPRGSRDKRFRDEWIKYYIELPQDANRTIGLIDPAFTTGAYSDFTGIVIASTTPTRDIYVRYAEEHKVEPFSLFDIIFELSDKYKVPLWGIEDVAAQRVLKYFAEYLAAKKNKRITFIPLKHGGRKKETRIMSLQPFYASGKIFMKTDQLTLLHQLRNFPILAHDDTLDALAYLPQVLYDGVCAPPPARSDNTLHFNDISKKKSADKFVIRPPNDISGRGVTIRNCYEAIPISEVKSNGN